MSNIGIFGGFHYADDVEADALEHTPAKCQIFLCRSADPRLFQRGHGFDRRSASERAPHFDLDEHENAAVERDQVDFAAAASEIALEDVIAAPDEEISRRAFAAAAQRRGGSRSPALHGSASAVEKSNIGEMTGANERRCSGHGPNAFNAAR